MLDLRFSVVTMRNSVSCAIWEKQAALDKQMDRLQLYITPYSSANASYYGGYCKTRKVYILIVIMFLLSCHYHGYCRTWSVHITFNLFSISRSLSHKILSHDKWKWASKYHSISCPIHPLKIKHQIFNFFSDNVRNMLLWLNQVCWSQKWKPKCCNMFSFFVIYSFLCKAYEHTTYHIS
jgi:hypothetical protein